MCMETKINLNVFLKEGRKKGMMHNTFYLQLYGTEHMVKDHSDSDRQETHCCHYIDYSFRLTAKDLLYAPPHRQNRTQPLLHQ